MYTLCGVYKHPITHLHTRHISQISDHIILSDLFRLLIPFIRELQLKSSLRFDW